MPVCILIASRSVFLVTAVRARLPAARVQVIGAETADQLAQALQDAGAHCVIIDTGLVGEEWRECCRRIRGIPSCRGVSVILLAETPTREFVLEARQAGATDVVVKQEGFGVLLQRLERLGLSGDRPAADSPKGNMGR
jgi:DNA-binding response OmpR family regulator